MIETDLLISLIMPSEKHHRIALRYARNAKLSPYSLTELDLLIRSNAIEVKDLKRFYQEVEEILKLNMIKILTPNPRHLAKAQEFRRAGLSYFDSLHASVALIDNELLVSFDQMYERIEELNSINPLKRQT